MIDTQMHPTGCGTTRPNAQCARPRLWTSRTVIGFWWYADISVGWQTNLSTRRRAGIIGPPNGRLLPILLSGVPAATIEPNLLSRAQLTIIKARPVQCETVKRWSGLPSQTHHLIAIWNSPSLMATTFMPRCSHVGGAPAVR
jgi:hypothetical protein